MILMNIHEDDGDDINVNIVDFDDGDDDHIVRRKCRQITSAESMMFEMKSRCWWRRWRWMVFRWLLGDEVSQWLSGYLVQTLQTLLVHIVILLPVIIIIIIIAIIAIITTITISLYSLSSRKWYDRPPTAKGTSCERGSKLFNVFRQRRRGF